jgi:protein-S-isoprenylcysteine O-methyltransferase Ste14
MPVKICYFLIRLIVVSLSVYAWGTLRTEGLNLDIFPTYFYFFLVIGSTLSDRIFYRGQKTEHKKEHEITSLYLALFWYLNLIAPVVEYVHFLRSNLIITLLGTTLVVSGTVLRGLGLKTLGRFFSRDVETWENQRIINTGIYKYIRHPAYAGNILQTIGFPLVLNSYFSLLLAFLTICGFLWRIEVEEEFLCNKFPEYQRYIL